MAQSREEEIVIHCPGESHSEAQIRLKCPTCERQVVLQADGPERISCRTCHRALYKSDGESQSATPKILLVAKIGSVSRFKVQCNSNRCKHSQGDKYNGWYEIELKQGGTTYTIEPLPRQHFALRTAPAILLAGDR